MRDGPDQSLSISERMDRLIAYDNARRSLAWKLLDPIPLPNSPNTRTTSMVGHIVSYTENNVLVYRPPSRFRGVKERIWKYEFDFPHDIDWVGVEPAQDLLLLNLQCRRDYGTQPMRPEVHHMHMIFMRG